MSRLSVLWKRLLDWIDPPPPSFPADQYRKWDSETPAPTPSAVEECNIAVENYSRFSRESPWTDQGKVHLAHAAAYSRWLELFGPPRTFELNEPPASFPAIVIYTRIRRTGLTECEFYWDYVRPDDFTRTQA